jgi:ABC-type phosphate transport system auxiliary subunit
MKTVFIILLSVFALSCKQSTPPVPDQSAPVAVEKTQPTPAQTPVIETVEKSVSLTDLQKEDVQLHQKRYQEFQQRVQAESDAMQREYNILINTIIRTEGIAKYQSYTVSPEGDKINVVVPKK